jgi:hypothetical protein
MNDNPVKMLSCNRFFGLLILATGHGSLQLVKSTLLVLALALVALPVAAEDWKTTDGTVYEDVKVIRVEDDAVTIIYKDGGALIFLYKLPPALQQKFDYDPVKAKIAAEKRAKEDAENSAALQKEIEQAEIVKRNEQIQNAQQLGNTNSTSH